MKASALRPLALLASASAALTVNIAHADLRWYNPRIDGRDTLRICYKSESVRATPTAYFPDRVELTLRYTGGNKLDRQHSYPTIRDTLIQSALLNDRSDLFTYAHLNSLYACEISWDYGLHWVLSEDEVSGDRN